jgi:arabinogalactan endo-1,4-beta-galactosidase
MNSRLVRKLTLASLLSLTLLSSCQHGEASSDGSGSSEEVSFSYDSGNYSASLGSKTNQESHDYGALKVNPTSQTLRGDFAYGVDASMVNEIEKAGGVYYNQDGVEQDVFQILRDCGVNFCRFRLWNKPADKFGRYYGGGNNDVSADLALAKRARAAGLNVLIDFHYSDFWADPDHQIIPKDWASLDKADVPASLKTFTSETLQAFADAGVNVAAVQLGNEINNGMMGDYGAIDWSNASSSFDYIASLLSSGIEGAKSVFPQAKTIIHLANGTNKDEFQTYFEALSSRGVNYDIVGASYYPYLNGSLTKLQANLDNVASALGKPVMIMETSWGFTNDYNAYTDNQYDSSKEDTGGYLTSEQAQATSTRDVLDVLSKVPDKRGLGCFYWEPAWLPVAGKTSETVSGSSWATARGQSYIYNGDDKHASSYTDGLATWSNQAWFSYSGKVLPSAYLYKAIANGGMNAKTEESVSARSASLNVTLNLAAKETLPATCKVVTDFDAIRDGTVVWDAAEAAACSSVGTYTVHGVVDGKYNVTLSAKCIENFVVDPSFENQGETDALKSPWFIRDQVPSTEKVVKLDRKSDYRTGSTDLNWYHSSKDFSFNVYQTISNLPAGTYDLTTYIKAEKLATYPHKTLYVYIKVGETTTQSAKQASDICLGWAAGYQTVSITSIVVPTTEDVEIGIVGSAVARAWAHNDDWSLVRVA